MILDSIDNLLPGLLPATFRGIAFFVPDTSIEAGRRVAEHLFPGVDAAAYDDFGLHPATISIDGMIVGADYIAKARMLRAAFEMPGPGTLIHPWLGPMSVILSEPAEISFSASELRVVRFSASFKRHQPLAPPAIASTASLLINAALALIAVSAALARAPASRTISRLRTDATRRAARAVADHWQRVTGHAGATLRSALPAELPIAPERYAAMVATVTATLYDQVADLKPEAAVAPAAEALARPATELTPRQALDLTLKANTAFLLGASRAPSTPDRVLLTGAAGDALGRAALIAAHAELASRADAIALRNDLAQALDAFDDAVSPLYDTDFASEASAATRAVAEVRLKLIADINETIGRLPATLVVTVERPTDAFQIANHIHGDRPERIEASYRAIVARNRPRHPAMLPVGAIEVAQ